MWIQTRSGNKFYPLEPSPTDVSLFDIGWALSNICRFNGHVRKFYSVAEHSVLMSLHFHKDRRLAKWALFHDAAEAYVGDMVYPIKRGATFGTEFAAAEEKILRVIAEVFRLKWPIPDAVKAVDRRICLTEAKHLMTIVPEDFQQGNHKPLMMDLPLWSPEEARFQFYRRAQELNA